MKSRLTRVTGGLLLLSVLGGYMLLTDRVMPWNKAEAIATTLQWGGLDALPVPAGEVDVRTSGGMFSRTFMLRFKCDAAALHKWIKGSKRLATAHYAQEGDQKTYKVYPGEAGAMGGTIVVQGQEVIIRMSWS